MTNEEFSNGFDTLVRSYTRFRDFDNKESQDTIEFDEYEKSIFLTKAQTEMVVKLYSGKNPNGDSFESTEELRRYLESLVKTTSYSKADEVSGIGVSASSVFFKLPSDLAFITMEQVIYSDESLGCHNGNRASVFPVTQDEYSKVKDNPFRGPTRYKVIRIDCGNQEVEIISKYKIGTYLLKYLSKPSPIILEDLPNNLTIEGVSKETECKLNSILHYKLLERAVEMALLSKGINVRNN